MPDPPRENDEVILTSGAGSTVGAVPPDKRRSTPAHDLPLGQFLRCAPAGMRRSAAVNRIFVASLARSSATPSAY